MPVTSRLTDLVNLLAILNLGDMILPYKIPYPISSSFRPRRDILQYAASFCIEHHRDRQHCPSYDQHFLFKNVHYLLGGGNVLFNDALNTFYLRLYVVRHMVKDHSDKERGNPLPPYRLLFPNSSKGSFICIIPQTG